jgi:hypothetical protein
LPLPRPAQDGDGFGELLPVVRQGFIRFLENLMIVALQILDAVQNLLDIRHRLAVVGEIDRIVKQQVVPFGAARFQHFDRRLLRKGRRRCVDIDDAIDDPPHSEKIIDRQEMTGAKTSLTIARLTAVRRRKESPAQGF